MLSDVTVLAIGRKSSGTGQRYEQTQMLLRLRRPNTLLLNLSWAVRLAGNPQQNSRLPYQTPLP